LGGFSYARKWGDGFIGIVAAIWLALSIFVWWRRSASNLTPVQAARTNKKAQPDFLKVDQKARDAAIERGEKFDKELERQEREEAKQARSEDRSPLAISQRIAGLVTFLMSLFTLASMISSAIWQVNRMGDMVRENSLQRIGEKIAEYPVTFSVIAFVVCYRGYRFISQRQSKGT